MTHPAVIAARRWLGTPYVHQASQRGAGADCLGLVRGVWRETVGPEPIPVPAYSRDWSEAQHDEVLWRMAEQLMQPRNGSAMQPGDVLLFRMRRAAVAKHLGILTSAGQRPAFIHSYTGHGVVESALTGPWSRRIVAVFVFPIAE